MPDETTILRFRHLLERHQLAEALFWEVAALLGERGLVLREGTIVDATLIAAPPSTKNRARKRDEEMSQSRKGNQWHFGMKVHIGADGEHGLVHAVEGSTGKVSDDSLADVLLHGAEGIRAKVEHPFRVLKCQFGHRKVRYRGLFKNEQQPFSLFALANLYLARRMIPATRENHWPKPPALANYRANQEIHTILPL